MKRFVIFLLLAATAAAGPAVRPDIPGLANLADAAIGQIESGDVDGAALSLGASNLALKGSLPWYHQSALVLLGRAEQLKVAGESAAANRAATAAIRILQQGDTKGAGADASADRAQLYVQLAAVYDHFFGDRASARQYYQLALQQVPDLATAKAALAIYDAEAARLRQLQGGGN